MIKIESKESLVKENLIELLDSPTMADIKNGIFSDEPKKQQAKFLPEMKALNQGADFDFRDIEQEINQMTSHSPPEDYEEFGLDSKM